MATVMWRVYSESPASLAQTLTVCTSDVGSLELILWVGYIQVCLIHTSVMYGHPLPYGAFALRPWHTPKGARV